MVSNRPIWLIILEITLHTIILASVFWITSPIHNSDSLITQVPETFDVANNITNVGFGIKEFSVGGYEDIEFSDEQKAVFGNQFKSAHITFHVFRGCMILAFIVPIISAVIQSSTGKMQGKSIFSRVAKYYSCVSIPLIVVFTLLMVVPFTLLAVSNLCGPNYIELRFQVSKDYDDHDDGCDQYLQGTEAIIHEDVPAKCQLGRSGIATVVMIGIWTLVLIVQAFVLYHRGKALQVEDENDSAAKATVIEVYGLPKEDDGTVEMDGKQEA